MISGSIKLMTYKVTGNLVSISTNPLIRLFPFQSTGKFATLEEVQKWVKYYHYSELSP